MPAKPSGPWLRQEAERNRGYYVWLCGRRVCLHTKDKTEADLRYHALMLKAGMGEPAVVAAATTLGVRELVGRFLGWAHGELAESTVAKLKFFLARFLRHLVGNPPAASITPDVAHAWLRSHRWGRTTRHGAASALKQCFKYGVEQLGGLLPVNPLAKLVKPRPQRSSCQLTPEQVAAIDAALDRVRELGDILRFLMATGCRTTEARRIESRHLTPEDRCVRFPPAEGKGERPRVIHCNEAAWALLTAAAAKHSSGPAFRNRYGGPWTKDALARAAARLRKRIGLAHWTPRTLRHWYATRALLAGIDTVTVGELMGHANQRMVAETYQHVIAQRGHLAAAAERAAAAASPPAVRRQSRPDRRKAARPRGSTTGS